MTTDAAKQAEQFHVAPCTFCGPNFLGTCPHRPSIGATAPPLSQRSYEPPKVTTMQPAISAVYAVDLKPLISFFATELQRLRDQLEVQRSTANSAREALVMCEERCKAAERILAAERQSCARELDRLNAERGNAVAELERCKATMGSATTAPPALVPGSVDAAIEAYRLLCGHEPYYGGAEWFDRSAQVLPCGLHCVARNEILGWLDANAPGGRP